MKRTLVLASIAVVALVAAGIAVGHGIDGTKNVKEVAGTFTATTVSKLDTRTCTTSDGKTLVTTNGTYAGPASGDADLTGPVTIRAHSTVNTTDGVGVVWGTLRVGVAGGDTEARFDAVLKGSQLAGLASGRAHEPSARLIANLSSTFNPTTGFANGKLGGGTAVAPQSSSARARARVRVGQETSRAEGTVTAVSSTSITVAGAPRAPCRNLRSLVAALTVGARADRLRALRGREHPHQARKEELGARQSGGTGAATAPFVRCDASRHVVESCV
jgi:hypothetical protein